MVGVVKTQGCGVDDEGGAGPSQGRDEEGKIGEPHLFYLQEHPGDDLKEMDCRRGSETQNLGIDSRLQVQEDLGLQDLYIPTKAHPPSVLDPSTRYTLPM